MPEVKEKLSKKNIEDSRVKCDVCGQILEEDSRFYVIKLAYVTQNDKDTWDYEPEEDDSVYCLGCAGKVLPKL